MEQKIKYSNVPFSPDSERSRTKVRGRTHEELNGQDQFSDQDVLKEGITSREPMRQPRGMMFFSDPFEMPGMFDWDE
jgi:hypothetical protein